MGFPAFSFAFMMLCLCAPNCAARAVCRGIKRLLPILLLSGLLTACGAEEDGELSGRFGAGSGGPAVAEDAVVTQELQTRRGITIGSAAFDASYFQDVRDPERSEPALSLVSTVDALLLTGDTISGRPDTPCRYTAATLARDEDFEILRSGDRKNSTGLEFHQVDLRNGSQYRSLYCATLLDPLGILILADAEGSAPLTSEQMHYVLNSIQGLD